MIERPVDWRVGNGSGSARSRSSASALTELRAAILAIGYREELLDTHRARLDTALETLVAESLAAGEHVETLLVRIKQLCSEPDPADVHRLQRAWLVRRLVERCIRRYYGVLTSTSRNPRATP